MIMIFLAAVLCPFFPESVLIFIVSSVELLNGLVLDSLSFVWFSLSHQGSRRRIASLIYFILSSLAGKTSNFGISNVYRIFFSLQLLFWLSLRWQFYLPIFFLPIMLFLILLLLGMELYLYMIFRGADVFTAALSNQMPAAHRSQSANATGKSKLIKTGDAYEFSLIPFTVILGHTAEPGK